MLAISTTPHPLPPGLTHTEHSLCCTQHPIRDNLAISDSFCSRTVVGGGNGQGISEKGIALFCYGLEFSSARSCRLSSVCLPLQYHNSQGCWYTWSSHFILCRSLSSQVGTYRCALKLWAAVKHISGRFVLRLQGATAFLSILGR